LAAYVAELVENEDDKNFDDLLRTVSCRSGTESFASKLFCSTAAGNFKYEQFYPKNWLGDDEAESRHERMLRRIASWPRRSNSSPIDAKQFILLELIAAFSTDFVRLDKNKEVEDARVKFASLLQR